MGRTKARKTLQAEFSQEGMRRLADQIRQYSVDVEEANKRFVRRLAEEGFDIAQIHINSSDHYDKDKPIGTMEIINDNDGEVAGVSLQFTGQQVLFVEFGAGFYWNTAINPKAKKFGYGVGTYPNQKHANNPNGWSYYGDDDRWHHTRGTQATMPMYNASVAMREKLIEVAREVYQGVI